MPKIATIGFFDGVHRGHRFLFAQLQEHAKLHHLLPVIYTFEQHPKQVLTGEPPLLLTSAEERKQLLEQYAEVRMLDFADVQHLTAEQFMRYLHEQQDVNILLLGYDHRFGSDGLKGFSEFEHIARNIGLHVLRAYECLVDGVPVSSSRIRKLLAAGQVHDANRLLGCEYTLSGVVTHGNGIGNQIGFPTANIQLSGSKQLPMQGVYAAQAHMDGVEYKAIVNIGTNPTVGNSHVTIEAHLIDYQGDLYDKQLSVSFHRFLRPEQKFSSLSCLQEQIKNDIQQL
jgi:riboflavin kinase/FMN adenylyltransferase